VFALVEILHSHFIWEHLYLLVSIAEGSFHMETEYSSLWSNERLCNSFIQAQLHSKPFVQTQVLPANIITLYYPPPCFWNFKILICVAYVTSLCSWFLYFFGSETSLPFLARSITCILNIIIWIIVTFTIREDHKLAGIEDSTSNNPKVHISVRASDVNFYGKIIHRPIMCPLIHL